MIKIKQPLGIGRWLAASSALVVALAMYATSLNAQVLDTTLWMPNGPVTTIAQSGDAIVIGGAFSRVGALTGGGAVLSASTATLVTPFPRVAGVVHVAQADGSGGWYIGGLFDAVGGLPRSNLAHILADGSVAAWNPNANGTVRTLALSASTVYVGGDFTMMSGAARNRLAALNATTGALGGWSPSWDNLQVWTLGVSGNTAYVGGYHRMTAFDATTGAVTWNPIMNGDVFSMALGVSTVYIGGTFTQIGGINGLFRRYVAELNVADGTPTAWDPNPDGQVEVLSLVGGSVYAGGGFNVIGGQPRQYIAELDATSGAATSWNPNANAVVFALAVDGSTVYAAGWFTSIGGQLHDGFAALDAATGAATAWDPGPYPAITPSAISFPVVAASGGSVFVGGTFVTIGGTVRNNIAALDASTGAVSAWNPNANGRVLAVATNGSTVYAGGEFTSIGGQPRRRIAGLDPTSGLATAWDPGANNAVHSLALSGSTVYAGGAFGGIGGQARSRIAALDAVTGLATAWDPNASGSAFPTVRSIAVSGPVVHVGGNFLSIGGQTRNYLAALDATTGLATGWHPDANDEVLALTVSGNTLYAGGAFTDIGWNTRSYLGALDITTGLATGWDPAPDDTVHAIAVNGSQLVVAGTFSTIGGQPRAGLAAVDAATGLATDWSFDTDGATTCLAVSGGTVYAGGTFTRIGGQVSNFLAAVKPATTTNVPPTMAEGRFALEIRPNPMRGTGLVRFMLPVAERVTLTVFDLSGRKLAAPMEHVAMAAGHHEASLDTRGWPPGIYLYRLEAGGEAATRKMVVVE